MCCDVMSHSLRPCGLHPTRLVCLWDSPGKNTEVGCHCLLQGVFPPRDQTHFSCTAGPSEKHMDMMASHDSFSCYRSSQTGSLLQRVTDREMGG